MDKRLDQIDANTSTPQADLAELKTDGAESTADVRMLSVRMGSVEKQLLAVPEIIAQQLADFRVQLSREIAGIAASREAAYQRLRVDALEKKP